MSAPYATNDRVTAFQSAAVAAGSTTARFKFGKPVYVKRIVAVYTTAQTTAGAAATFGVKNADNSTGSVTKGSFTFPVAAVNSVLKADVAASYPNPVVGTGEISQPSTVTTGRVLGYQTSLPGEILVVPGQEFWIDIAAGGAAGVADIALEYREEGQNVFSMTDMAVTLS